MLGVPPSEATFFPFKQAVVNALAHVEDLETEDSKRALPRRSAPLDKAIVVFTMAP